MKQKDMRLKTMNEVLSGIKVLKLYAWEPSFERDIMVYREKELNGIRSINYFNALGAMCWLLTPYLVYLVYIYMYILIIIHLYNIVRHTNGFSSILV